MLSLKICCPEVSLYLPPSLYSFHFNLVSTVEPFLRQSTGSAVLCPREPDHHLKNNSTNGEPIYLSLSLHRFHILIRCPLSNFSPGPVTLSSPHPRKLNHHLQNIQFGDAAFGPREPVHHLKNISTNGKPIFNPVLA